MRRFPGAPERRRRHDLSVCCRRCRTELEYRFVGRHLVLLDVEANLVVDVLRRQCPRRIETPANRSPGACEVHPELPGVLDVTPRTE